MQRHQLRFALGKAREQPCDVVILSDLVNLAPWPVVHQVLVVSITNGCFPLTTLGLPLDVAMSRPAGDVEDGRSKRKPVLLAAADLTCDAQKHLLADLLGLSGVHPCGGVDPPEHRFPVQGEQPVQVSPGKQVAITCI